MLHLQRNISDSVLDLWAAIGVNTPRAKRIHFEVPLLRDAAIRNHAGNHPPRLRIGIAQSTTRTTEARP
jgi:hypothetical protein